MGDMDGVLEFALAELEHILDANTPSSPLTLNSTQAEPDQSTLSTVAVSVPKLRPVPQVKRRPTPSPADDKCLQGKQHPEALAARGVRFDAPAQPEVGRLHAPLRRTGSSHGRSTVDSLAAWCPRGRGSGAGEAEAAALPGLLTPPLPLDGFEFCEPRYGWGDVRPGRRRGREASLAEWVGAAGGEAEHGVEAGVRAARGDRPLTGVASLQGIAEAWLASDTDFLHCDFDCQCDTAEAVSAAWRHDGADSGGRQMGAWWRRRLVRLGIALAAFAGGFAAASLGLRRLRL